MRRDGMSDFRRDLCKKCIHTKVCMKDKNVCGDVFVPGNPLLFDNKKLWEKYEEKKAKGFPCDDFVDANIVPKWIPVTERLPRADRAEQVLINLHYLDGSNEVSLGEHWNCPDIPEEDGWGGFGGNGVVTHWMPLPEPPKEEV